MLKNWTREQRQRKSEKAVSVSIVFFLFFFSIIPLGYRIPSVTGRPFSPDIYRWSTGQGQIIFLALASPWSINRLGGGRWCDTFSRIRDSDVKGAFMGRGASNDEIYSFGVYDKIEAPVWG